jgi:hypothetical protein
MIFLSAAPSSAFLTLMNEPRNAWTFLRCERGKIELFETGRIPAGDELAVVGPL